MHQHRHYQHKDKFIYLLNNSDIIGSTASILNKSCIEGELYMYISNFVDIMVLTM